MLVRNGHDLGLFQIQFVMLSLDDHVRQIFQRICAYSRFFIFVQFVERTSSQFIYNVNTLGECEP